MKSVESLDQRAAALRALREIPGIGPSLARDLYSLGVRQVADLKRRSPEALYRRLEKQTGTHQDRCVLYVFRCAAYFARTSRPSPRLLQWWNWTDRPRSSRRSPTQVGKPNWRSAS